MGKIFSYVDTFFTSLHSYFNYNSIFITFIAISLLTILIVFISTSTSYEAKLIKAIDMFNNYFVNNPKITEDNLVSFNQKMRGKKVPKELRKQWQQFVLYREKKASEYMSFENCVEIPLRNSKFERDKRVLNLVSYILATFSLLLNLYYSYEVGFAEILQRAMVVPVIILILNYIVTIFLEFKRSAIVSDLNQNYQYFETNIDKATQTLPEFVDYEVLFEKNEIKKGIPILYQYLQRRAEEEKRELEKARLKNVEHEKFNFDEAGLAGSLVLERAMQEVENYLAERKKYSQDIEQINTEITQEDMAYRETTKEYNRQMQVSKEAFANYKSQLEQETSTISINYLKKQQQAELDRQRNFERNFDAATEKHKNIIERYQQDLDTIDGYIAKSRQALEKAMMSEFDTYNGKVYDEANKVVEEREKEKYAKIKADMVNLEEELHTKKQEIEMAYSQNMALNEQISELSNKVKSLDGKKKNKKDDQNRFNPVDFGTESQAAKTEEYVNTATEQPVQQPENVNEVFEPNYADNKEIEEPVAEEVKPVETSEKEEKPEEPKDAGASSSFSYEDYLKSIGETTSYLDGVDEELNKKNQEDEVKSEPVKVEEKPEEDDDEDDDFSWLDNVNPTEISGSTVAEGVKNEVATDDDTKISENKSTVQTDESEDDSDDEGGNELDHIFDIFDEESEEDLDNEKEITEEENTEEENAEESDIKEETPRRKAGRPRKVLTEEEINKPKRKAGRPRKIKTEEDEKPKRSVGRPRKEKSEEDNKPKRSVGRPRKENVETPSIKRGRGRPKKLAVEDLNKNVDLEAYLEVIEDAIARENEKMKKTQQKLASKADLKSKKK